MLRKYCVMGLLTAAASAASPAYRQVDVGETPFGMKPIPEFVFPDRNFAITDYGAQPGEAKCTAAFAQAIAACAAAGGGHVVVPKGSWHTGPIHLKSNVDLHLEEGAVLSFSDDLADCLPPVMSSWEGLECVNYSPLVYAYCCTNVAITGRGSLEPRMRKWARHFRETSTNIQQARGILYKWGAEDHPVGKRVMPEASDAVMRPQLVQMNRSVNVRLEGITVRDSPFWTIHLYQSENVIVRGVRVRAYGFNNDGIDIEMTRNVLVEDCDISAGDDGFVMKAGRNRDAWRINRPTENVVVRNCRLPSATALLAVGSEMSGGVRNVCIHDCEVGDVARLYYVKTNHRRGGFVDNIVIRGIRARSAVKLMAVETEVLYQWRVFPDYERRLTKISNLLLENVDCAGARSGVEIYGDPELPIDGVTFRNVRIGTLMNDLSKVNGAVNVRMEGLMAVGRGAVTNIWDTVMPFMPKPTVKGAAKPKVESQWKGKKVAFLGDSITDAQHVGCTANYWNFLPSMLGIDAYVYGKNGWQMDGMLKQAERLFLDLHWYVDAIFVLAGTNDYNGNVPRGEWYEVADEETPRTSGTVTLPRRKFSTDEKTFRGRINRLMKYLKENFPDQQIVLMTALHRGFAQFGPKNIQPDETFPNLLGLHIDDYNDDIREAGRIWSVPVIDLYSESGLFPLATSHQRYFHDADTDMLHPSARGHDRIARTMLYKMLSLPPDFKRADGLFE